jgi:hypothetical protein
MLSFAILKGPLSKLKLRKFSGVDKKMCDGLTAWRKNPGF